MRIALVVGRSAGGIGRHVASLVPRFAAAGHDVVVWAPPSTAVAHGLVARLLTRVAEIRSADIVHAHGLQAGALTALADLGGPPLVVSWHNQPPTGRGARVGAVLQRISAGRADVLLGASADLVQAARRCGARDARLGPVAAPTLDLTGADPDRFRASLGLTSERIVLTVGRLAPQKDLGVVVGVARRLAEDPAYDDVVFVIVGEGPERAELELLIAAARSSTRTGPSGDRVRLAGARPDPVDAYAAATASLLTSRWEARALVAQEALLAGVPLVATAVGGVPELVGDAAVLVPPGQVDAAASAVAELLDHPDRAAELAARGRRRAAGWPTEDDVAAELLSCYAALLD